MSNRKFIADLSSTEADIRVLKSKEIDAKKIKLNGTNIEDLLSSAGSGVIIEDGREVKTKYDIWEHAAVENADGSVTVKNLYIPDASGWLSDFGDDFVNNQMAERPMNEGTYVISCIDGKMYKNEDGNTTEENPGTFVANIDTSKIVDGSWLFYQSSEFMLGGVEP